MAYLQVRDFPEELHEELRLLAKKEHRSVSQQVIVAVEQCVAEAAGRARVIQPFSSGVATSWDDNGEYRKGRKKVLESIRATPKPEFSFTPEEIVAIVHEGRDERDDRIRL